MKYIKAAFAIMSPAERWAARKINGLMAICGFCGLLFGLMRNESDTVRLGIVIIAYSCTTAVALWED